MAFGNYYGGVTNDKNILDKLAEMTKELREVKGMLINPEVQAEQIKYQAINEAKAEADKLINEANAEAEKIIEGVWTLKRATVSLLKLP